MNKNKMSRAKTCESVKVVVRCRPMNGKEEAAACEQIVDMDMKLGQVTIRNPKATSSEMPKSFTFDAVYDHSSKQSELYDETVRPLVDSVLQGFNGTVFAYGQTGTGKTYTMQGIWADQEKRGIIPNTFEHIFTHISRSQDQQYLVRASYLEIYQEEIRDLLSKDQNKKLDLKEKPETGVYIKDLSSFVTKNVKEIEHVMNVGNQTRAVASTNMNEYSSRSHAIFVVTIECSELGLDGENHIRVGKLNLVDLAGSERQSKTGVQGERLKEAAKINLSLSALGNVISALVDGKSTHIPYRDSKLTRLLEDSLGGNAKTIMVATVGPASSNYDESLTTLRYANRTKNIKNKPRINEDPKDALLREFQEEIARLKAQLERRGMLSKKRRKSQKKIILEGEELMDEVEDTEDNMEKNMENYLKEQKETLEKEKAAIQDDHNLVAEEKQKLLEEKEKMMEDLRKEQEATEQLAAKFKATNLSITQCCGPLLEVQDADFYKEGIRMLHKRWTKCAMESKLLVGGKNIIDHTNEQQKMLEQKRQEIAEQKRREREIQQQMMLQDEETLELRETYTSLQQEVEMKTKKLKKVRKKLLAKFESVKAEIQDLQNEHVKKRQNLEHAQNELTRDLKLKYLIIENFIPPEEKNKIMNRLCFDCEEDQWKFLPLVPADKHQMKKRSTSAVGYKRPISQYARVAMSMGIHPRYRAENILFLELDMATPQVFELDIPRSWSLHGATGGEPHHSSSVFSDRSTAARVRKSRSWSRPERRVTSSSSFSSLASGSQLFSHSEGKVSQ